MGTVRMGEIEVSSETGEELVARGLGSCIGLAMIDRRSGVAGPRVGGDVMGETAFVWEQEEETSMSGRVCQ